MRFISVPVFKFKARDALGKPITGEMEAENEQGVANTLAEKGLYVITVEAKPDRKLVERITGIPTEPRIRSFEMVALLRQLSTMVRAGIPILSAFDLMLERASSHRLRAILQDIRDSLAGGSSLSQAFGAKRRNFSPLMVSAVEVGEATGNIETVLTRLAAYKEMEHNLRASIRSAMAYPTVIFLVAIGVATFLVVSVLPKFEAVYSRVGVVLPLPTRILLAISHFLQNYWYFLIAAVAAVIVALILFKRSTTGSRFFDRLWLKVPIISTFTYKSAVLRFVRAMELMVRTGVDIILALDIAAGTVGNSVIERAIRGAKENIRDGASLSESLVLADVFEPIVVQMVKVGEETGTVDELLSLLASDCEQELNRLVQNLPKIIEPIMLVFIAFIVFIIALSLFLPIFNLITTLKKI
ncbi:MAG: type II secretion system F family protein [Planctomycetota bacterium]|nr:type II secretion system F family protein [Planctomycetota bacterium]